MQQQAAAGTGLQQLDARATADGAVNVIIETPKGHRNKYVYTPALGVFALTAVLPAGAVFPYDFGFIPGTLAEDGDPLDVLVLMEEPAFVGCLVPVRLIGIIEADQTERDGQTTRNDRLLGVSVEGSLYSSVESLDDLPDRAVAEVEHFFISYNAMRGKQFTPRGRFGSERATSRLQAAATRATARAHRSIAMRPGS